MIYELIADKIQYFVVHCSDSPPDRGDTARDIHRWHINKPPGYDAIGYHKVILRDGTVEDGRPEYMQGAHCRGYNDRSLGVCLIGKDQFTDAQMDSLAEVLSEWDLKYSQADVVGHCDLDASKTCPNFDAAYFYYWDESSAGLASE